MPITPVQAVATLVPSLAGATMIGTGTPKFAQGFGLGLSIWTPTITIGTVDAGSAGAGKGVPVPIALLPPVLYGNIVAGFTSQGILGLMAPLFITGLTAGLTQLYLQAFTNTVHVGVGWGRALPHLTPYPQLRRL
jgi:hypothetical protein